MEKNFNPIVFDIITKTKGDVLDVGFGWGISSNYFYNKGVKSLTIIEKRKDVYHDKRRNDRISYY